MLDKSTIQQLRNQGVDDSAIFDRAYQEDASFKTKADLFNGKNITGVQKLKLPTALINKHYMGYWANDLNSSSDSTIDSVNSMIDSNPEDLGKLLPTRAKGNWLEANPYSEASVGGFLGNIPKSAGRLAVDIGTAAMNPIQTAETIGKAALGGAANLVETAFDNESIFNDPFGSETLASGIGQLYVDRYGSIEAAKKTAYEDPTGFASDLATLVAGAGGAIRSVGRMGQMGVAAATAGKSSVPISGVAGTLGRTAGKIADIGGDIGMAGIKMEPLYWMGKGAYSATKAAVGTGKFLTSQFSGLSPSAIQTIIDEPQLFKSAQRGVITRGSLANKVFNSLETKIDDLDDLGKSYNAFRSDGIKINVPQSWFRSQLENRGFMFDDAKKAFIATAESPPISGTELNAINDLYGTYFNKGTLSGNAALNARSSMAQMAGYGLDKSDEGMRLFRDLRSKFNDQIAHPQIDGLGAADAMYSPKISELKDLKKEFLTVIDHGNGMKEYVLKDTAVAKIANATKGQKPLLVAKLEKLVPDILKEVRVLNALEDVEYAGGRTVGAYTRAFALGTGVATANPAPIVISLIAQPSIIVPILQKYGVIKGLAKSAVNGIINKLYKGERLSRDESKIVSKAVKDASTRYDDVLPAAKPITNNVDNVTGANAKLTRGIAQGENTSGEAARLGKKFPTLTTEEISALTPEEKATGILGGGDSVKKSVKVYHGTASDFGDFDLSFGGKSTGAKSGQRAMWFTDDPRVAKGYALYAAEDAPVQNIIKQSDDVMKQAQKLQASGKTAEANKLFTKADDLLAEAEKMDAYDSRLARRSSMKVKEETLSGDFYEVDAMGKTPQELSDDLDIDSWINKQLDIAKKAGKDGVVFKNLDDAAGFYDTPSTHYAIFEKSAIKPKSK